MRGIALPGSVRGAVVEIQDDFIVYINTNLCEEAQRVAVAHELRHIEKDHFYNEQPVVYNEFEAQ